MGKEDAVRSSLSQGLRLAPASRQGVLGGIPVTSACIPFATEVASGESNRAEPLKNTGQIHNIFDYVNGYYRETYRNKTGYTIIHSTIIGIV